MKYQTAFLALSLLLLISCYSRNKDYEAQYINADSLVSNIARYINLKVEVEGTIVHICGITGSKMKLRTDNGNIIKISPLDTLVKYDTIFYKKRIRVYGIVKESRIEIGYIDKMEKEKILLCHIDNSPCKDTSWIKKQIIKGYADSLCKKDIEKLRNTIIKSGKDYISVITIEAEKIEIIAVTEK